MIEFSYSESDIYRARQIVQEYNDRIEPYLKMLNHLYVNVMPLQIIINDDGVKYIYDDVTTKYIKNFEDEIEEIKKRFAEKYPYLHG